jgi:hypothetical protein
MVYNEEGGKVAWPSSHPLTPVYLTPTRALIQGHDVAHYSGLADVVEQVVIVGC